MKPVISIQSLSKQYALNKDGTYIALRDVITDSITGLFRRRAKAKTLFWALKDIDLEINEGERIGIIGHNGAGKSTLLKILSRITPPTSGRIEMQGRVASLLEVGTGFHPELTGRENIYLNGSILGIVKTEINKRLEEIIDFSGVEKFIDTPLKNYSSGMQLRLAFSVAAHLQAEILLIDEVLAVGDLEFQQKCIGKMEEISKTSGRTILFVSHNLGFVNNFCNRAVLLEQGQMVVFGDTNTVINRYIQNNKSKEKNKQIFGNGSIELLYFELRDRSVSTDYFFLGYPATIKIKIRARKKLNGVEVAFNIKDVRKDLISHVTSLDKQILIKVNESETLDAEIYLPQINFTPGLYTIDLFFLNNDDMCWGCENYTEFTVLNSDKALRPNGFPAHVKTYTDSSWNIRKL